MRRSDVCYLDAAATTRVDPDVAALVMHFMREEFGNAGSRTHSYGADAMRAVSHARAQIAEPLGAEPADVVFTSGATESDNLAILGLARFGQESGCRHIISSAIEHKAVLEPLEYLSRRGFEVTLVAPDRAGYVAAGQVLDALRPDTLLVSIMHVNNETGAVQPIGAIADGLSAHSAYFHVDAAQSFGKATPALRHPRIDLVALSGHKVQGPKGVGALVAKSRDGERAPLSPLMYGGGQERGLRPGTLPVPLIAGFGLASELAERHREARLMQARIVRKEALDALAPMLEQENGIVQGAPELTLPHILSVTLRDLDSEAAMLALQDIAALSNGSACTSASYSPSHVLVAMGLSEMQVQNTVRFSWSHDDTVPWRAISEALALFL
ncbi:aminotransferase class V-fold PLP-dependent enzyme [Blastomonas sp.]|uniref:aminotransferase class V-fold PLP-dependent enzyme n=1 Tax=Blastomonas sp. TaxID=1909299 RepID=UPI00406A5576